MIITVTPNPSVDQTLEFATIRIGEVNRAKRQHAEPSGKGINVSRALRVNGVASVAVAPLGGAEGRQLRDLLEAEGVGYQHVPVAGAVRVNVTAVTADGVVTKLNAPGPELSPDEIDLLCAAVRRRARAGGWVVAAGTLAPGMAVDFYARLGEFVHAASGRFAVDTSGAALHAAVAAHPELVKPNREELAELVGSPLATVPDVVEAAREVHAKTTDAVLVSLGRDGAVLVDHAGALHAHAPVARVVSPVGAGDNLLAGFLAGGPDRTAALREAVAWGAVAVRAPGSLGEPVTEADRRAVRIRPAQDVDEPLTSH